MAKSLDQLKRDFFSMWIEASPTSATYLGYPGYDDRVTVEDESFRSSQKRLYQAFLKELDGTRNAIQTEDDRIDEEIMRLGSTWTIEQIDRTHPLDWRSSADISRYVDVVYYNVSHQTGTDPQWDAIATRMEQIPDLIRQHRKNLERGLREKASFYRREVQRDGIELKSEISRYFSEEVPQAARKALGEKRFVAREKRLTQAAGVIDKALTDFVLFLEKSALPKSTDEAFVLGEKEYARRLKTILLSTHTPETLFAYGRRVVEETEVEMQKLSDEIRKTQKKKPASTDDLVHELEREAPANDEAMFAMYRDLVTRAASFLRKGKLFKIPDDYRIDIVETPAAFRNTLSVAAMNPIPPFLDGIPAQFWVTPTADEKHPAGNPELLRRNHSRYVAPNLVVHEAVPGHDLQLGASARLFIQGGRKDLSYLVRLRMPDVMSSLGVEGWAHYSEAMMAEEGFYTPEERLFQLKDAQWRNVRVVVDVGIHTGRMTYDEAVAYFDEKTRSGRETAEREMYRYSKWPLQAITYHLGKMDIFALRDETKKRLAGKTLDLPRFHEKLLSYHGIPLAYFRERFLDEVPRSVILTHPLKGER